MVLLLLKLNNQIHYHNHYCIPVIDRELAP